MEGVYELLRTDLPKEGIEKTKGANTRKGYDTTNWVYQYYVDRFNEVLEDGWGYDWTIVKEREGAYRSGQTYYETIVEVTIWVGNKENGRSHVGNHTSSNFGDSLKGAISSGFKKTAAFWGVGASAYCGTIDDDTNLPDEDKNKSTLLKGDFNKAMVEIKKIKTKEDANQMIKNLQLRTWQLNEMETLTNLIENKAI